MMHNRSVKISTFSVFSDDLRN